VEPSHIWKTCTQVFRELFGDEKLTIGPETTARDIDGWDSVRHIELLVSLEQAFGIRFKTGEISKLRNVGEMVDLIARRLS
jgi:acyl carrier protein